MDIHGFLPSSEMEFVEKTEDSLALKLETSEETLKQYPFNFVLLITWKVKGSTLDITYQLENKDSRTMYFGIGGHPGFVDADLLDLTTLSLERVRDLQMVTSPVLRKLVEDNKVELITYYDLY